MEVQSYARSECDHVKFCHHGEDGKTLVEKYQRIKPSSDFRTKRLDPKFIQGNESTSFVKYIGNRLEQAEDKGSYCMQCRNICDRNNLKIYLSIA